MPLIEISSELECLQPAPVRILLPDGIRVPDGELCLREEGGGLTVPAQRDGDHLVAVLAGMDAGQTTRFRLMAGAAAPGVALKEEGPNTLSIVLPEGLFTTYNFDPNVARPFFYPVLAPGAKRVTRSYPMKQIAGEAHDHPHHRSFWTAYDEVNGVDNWSEAAGKHGWTKHKKIESRAEGQAFGGFAATALWTSHEGRPVLDERRSIRVYNVGPTRRLLDYDVLLTATYEDVHYGDTKEGGIMAWRVATTMDGNKGGRLENSNGAVGEKQCWGKRATWLDYSGPVEGQTLGITMMDHPGNFHHPCYWHARDYGLVGLNPFSKGAFEGGEKTGSNQKKGTTLHFRYRVLIHHGDAKEGRADDAYHAWVQGPAGKAVG